MDPPPDITRLLGQIGNGDADAMDQLLEAVYAELRQLAASKMAREAPGHTLQATALVHDAWLRLHGKDGQMQPWRNRAHFFSAAAEAMRRILVERARRKRAIRHGGEYFRIDGDDLQIALPEPDDELLAVSDALESFAKLDPEKSELVKLRYFVGMTLEEAAGVLNLSHSTAKRHWTFAKAWLAAELQKKRES